MFDNGLPQGRRRSGRGADGCDFARFGVIARPDDDVVARFHAVDAADIDLTVAGVCGNGQPGVR